MSHLNFKRAISLEKPKPRKQTFIVLVEPSIGARLAVDTGEGITFGGNSAPGL